MCALPAGQEMAGGIDGGVGADEMLVLRCLTVPLGFSEAGVPQRAVFVFRLKFPIQRLDFQLP